MFFFFFWITIPSLIQWSFDQHEIFFISLLTLRVFMGQTKKCSYFLLMSWGFEKANPPQVNRDILHRILDQMVYPWRTSPPFFSTYFWWGYLWLIASIQHLKPTFGWFRSMSSSCSSRSWLLDFGHHFLLGRNLKGCRLVAGNVVAGYVYPSFMLDDFDFPIAVSDH